MCDQQRLRPAWAYTQSDQSLCKSLEYFMNVQLLTDHHLMYLSLTGGCKGSSESTIFKMPHCWKSHVAAHLYFFMCLSVCPHCKFPKVCTWGGDRSEDGHHSGHGHHNTASCQCREDYYDDGSGGCVKDIGMHG